MNDDVEQHRPLLQAVHDHTLKIAAQTYDVAKAYTRTEVEKMRDEVREEMRADLERATGGRFADVRDNILSWLGCITVPDVIMPTSPPAPPAAPWPSANSPENPA